MYRTVAVALVVVLVAVHFTAAVPLVPTLPHRSTAAQWMTPWPLRAIWGQVGPRANWTGAHLAVVDYQYLDELIIGMIIGFLFERFVSGLGGLLDTFFDP
ncbi:MAG TPA: hypothetical protein VNN19_05775 [bacterium]|nr:hypothetical protein [bacterium]